MAQKRAGFTVQEIEAMDYRQQLTLAYEQLEFEQKQKIEQQMLIAEAINYAYVGSQPAAKRGQTPQGLKEYRKWCKRKMRELYPELKNQTIWDNLRKKSMKIG